MEKPKKYLTFVFFIANKFKTELNNYAKWIHFLGLTQLSKMHKNEAHLAHNIVTVVLF